jgi:hypothetical protein
MSSMNAIAATSATSHDIPASGASARLRSIVVRPLPFVAAKALIEKHHYLHTLPGGTKLTFGVFAGGRLLGAVVFGAGPQNAFSLVHQATPDDCLALTRLWLSDELPGNSESRSLGAALRALRRHTAVKFLVTYADPSQGHSGTIYQATNWIYTGLSQAMPLYDLGDGNARQSRSLAHGFGTHSVKYLMAKGVKVQTVPQRPKHRYVYFLDQSWSERLKPKALPYPKGVKAEIKGENDHLLRTMDGSGGRGGVWGDT